MKIIGTSKITKGMKITLIKKAAKILKAKENDMIVFLLEKNKVILCKGKIKV